MGDGMQNIISKDKRHRSCCSVVAAAQLAGGARSEWKLDARASIAKVNGVFCNADTRCEQLQQKINMIKCLKTNNKLKRRSTKMEAPDLADSSRSPVTCVQTVPKRNTTARKVRRGAAAARACEEGITTHTSLRVNNQETVPAQENENAASRRLRPELRHRADGYAAASVRGVTSVCAAEHARPARTPPAGGAASVTVVNRVSECTGRAKLPRTARARHTRNHREVSDVGEGKERAVVEMFSRGASPTSLAGPTHARVKETSRGYLNNMINSRRISLVADAKGELVWRSRARHYETATVSSRMRRTPRAAPRRRRLPFVVSATVAPSHNLAVNLQKLLNSLKIKQTPRGIPPNLAHHLGLKNLAPDISSCAFVEGRGASGCAGRSYARALALLRVGDGPLPRYLRSLHVISSRREDVNNWDTRNCAPEEARRKLAEYAQLYRELERVD